MEHPHRPGKGINGGIESVCLSLGLSVFCLLGTKGLYYRGNKGLEKRYVGFCGACF